MDYINLKSRAKINLALDVLHKRDDGYHELEMIMQTISLYDNIYIKKLDKHVLKLKTNLKWLPADDKNIVYRAADYMIKRFDIKSGLFIELKKNIPVAAGLAGGSSNCAATIIGINQLFRLGLTRGEIIEIGGIFGTDVPYCIIRGTAIAKGKGDIITQIAPCPNLYIVLAKPPVSVSTKTVYANLDLSNRGQRPDTDKMIQSITNKDIAGIAGNLCNVLESVTIPMHSIIGDIKEFMVKNGAKGALMSGSGPTVFGIFEEAKESLYVAEKIKRELLIKDVFVSGIYGK